MKASVKFDGLKAVALKRAEQPRQPPGTPKGGQFASKDAPVPLLFVNDKIAQGPSVRRLFAKGRHSTTADEINAIGKKPDQALDLGDISNLSSIRNGHPSQEAFFASAPDSSDDARFLFAGKRVSMTVQEGCVAFDVDGEYVHDSDRSSSVKPSHELALMAKTFSRYLSSPQGRQVLNCTPTHDTEDRYATRVKHYKRNGFTLLSSEHLGLTGENTAHSLVAKVLARKSLMVLDNRESPKTFAPIGGADSPFEVMGDRFRLNGKAQAAVTQNDTGKLESILRRWQSSREVNV